ncbi:MAG: AbrB/MazE/SpoVT family DNA-binding domain-containing protein [Sphingomonadales bacterium]|nr:AbrB/MazE/SpoVT family DNA-binding domain-containing protein [Sphingomonadales bacterium]
MTNADKMTQSEWKSRIQRISGSMPWLKAKEVQYFKAKVFKSGNSLALRLPAGLGLAAGTEMELRVEDGEYSFVPFNRPKPKFNIDKVWGSATDLELIRPGDRLFEERPLFGDERPPRDRS